MMALSTLPTAHLLPGDWPPALHWALGLVVAGGAVWLAWHYWRFCRSDRQALERSENRYRRLFEEATVAMIEEDFTGVERQLKVWRAQGITDVRAHLAARPELLIELFQQVRPTAVNRRALALMNASDLADYRVRMRRHTVKAAPRGFAEQVAAVWDGRDVLTIDASFSTEDGQSHRGILQWTVPPVQEVRNLAQVLLIFTDLTAQRETEERYRQLFEGAVEGIFETLPSGVLRSANPAMARILGFAHPADLLAQSAEALSRIYVNPERRQQFFAALASRDFLPNYESEIRRPDGATAWIEENVRVVRDAAGQPLYFQGFVTDISARKQAELALRESEDRWRYALQGSAAGIWENNLVTGVTFYSDRSKEILGFQPGDISQRVEDWVSRIHPEDVEIGRRAMTEHLAGRRPFYQAEHRFRCKDGSYKWILSRGRAIFDSEGRLLRVVGTHVDINERKLAEHELRTSEARYRLLFEHSPIAILEINDTPLTDWMVLLRHRGVTDLAAYVQDHPDERAVVVEPLRITSANAAAFRMVGAKNLQEVFERLPGMVTRDIIDFRLQATLAIWEGRNTLDREVTLRAMDGTPRRVHIYRWIPVVDGQPQYQRAQLALVDLTAVYTAQQALMAERERMSVTLRAMVEGVMTVDHTGFVRYINESACTITGRTAADTIGRPLAEVCSLRHGRTEAALPLPDAAARAEGRVIELPPDTIIMGADGSRHPVEGRCAPMRDANGQDLGAVFVLRDVAEHVRLESELRRASNLESIGILAGGIAHDFNNILAIIMGNLTLALLDEQVKQSGGKRWLLEAERGAARARDLTQQLLTFAKGGEPVRTTVRLSDLVKEAAEFALHGSKVRCEFAIASGLRTAEVDKAQIGQVVQNLVINAVQAMPQGGVIRISLDNVTLATEQHGTLAPGNYLKLSIADNGLGIHPDHLSRIFEPYFTTKNTGIGLGLATVYSIVKKHRGHITVESELEAGTTFHLWLPAAEEPALPRPPSQAPFAIGMKGRVLFMDDEEPIRLMAAVLLGRLGLDPVIAEDGDEAVKLFRTARDEGRPFDAVVMDLTVPGGKGGLAALREMQAIDPAVRAIVSSGYSSDPVLANFREHGFRGMVAKPYRITDLANALRAVMGETPAA